MANWYSIVEHNRVVGTTEMKDICLGTGEKVDALNVDLNELHKSGRITLAKCLMCDKKGVDLEIVPRKLSQ